MILQTYTQFVIKLNNLEFISELMSNILSFMNDGFVEGNNSDALATLELLPDNTAKLTYSATAGLIAQRKASRQAESVCKSGFLLKSGERVGLGSKLEIVESDKLSDAHLREGYKYNRY